MNPSFSNCPYPGLTTPGARPSRLVCSSVKPQSHTSSLGSGVELSERTTSSKVRSETVDSILSAVAKKKVETSDKGNHRFIYSKDTGTIGFGPDQLLGENANWDCHSAHGFETESQHGTAKWSSPGSHSPVPKHFCFVWSSAPS